MKSLEKKSSFSLVSLVGTPFSLPFLGYLLCGVLGASSRYVSPIPPPPPRPPSLESAIRPSWRGVKNIMREGPPSKIQPSGTFSTCAVLSLTLSSALRTPQSHVFIYSYVHLQRKVSQEPREPGRPCLACETESCHSHLLPCPSPVPPPSLS